MIRWSMYETCVWLLLIAVLWAHAHDQHINKTWCPDIEKTELLMTFLVHRHGDRTPEAYDIKYSSNPEELKKLSEPYGMGQLTKAGYHRSYQLGKFFRRRYNNFLSTNLHNVHVRSTNYTRTINTIRIAITAAYSKESNWHHGMELMPFDCEVVPIKYDYNLAVSNCPKYSKYFFDSLMSDPVAMRPYTKLTEELSTELNYNLTKIPVILYPLEFLYDCQLSLGLPLGPVAQKLLPEVKEGGKAAVNVVFGNEEYVSLQAGVLLKEFFYIAKLVKAGIKTPRMRIYSAHDFNVFSFIAVTGALPKPGVPDFCSVFALELRRVKETGQLVVLPVYVSTPGAPEEYLKFEGCSGTFCDLEEFSRLTAKNVMNVHEYRTRCNFKEEYIIEPFNRFRSLVNATLTASLRLLRG